MRPGAGRRSRGERAMRSALLGWVVCLSCACGSSGPALLARGEQGPVAIAADPSGVYWLSNSVPGAGNAAGGLASARAGGGPRTLVAQLPGWDAAALYRSLLAGDGATVYWVQSDGAINYLDPAGMPQSLLKHQSQVSALAIVGDSAWYLQAYSEAVAVVRKRLA